jgi:uncharacterized iron-regulated membrane protein
MAVRSTLRRWHTWLGWLVGLPVLFWIVSGLVMVWKPIEEVRGEHLLSEPPAILVSRPLIPPAVQGVPIETLGLSQRAAGPRWVIMMRDGTHRLADPATGALLPPVSATEAMNEVTSRYTGAAKVASVRRTDPARPPIELRKPVAAWQVAMDDGTNFYVDPGSGAIIARRTGWWRFYDFMWALHIWDFSTREDANNPLTLGLGIASLVMAVMALTLLPLTIRRRKGNRRP